MRVKIVSQIEDYTDKMKKDPNLIKFLCSVNDDEYEELLSYDEVLDHIEKDETQDVLWKFKSIQAHEGPLDKSHRNYNGSSYNLLIEWENGEVTKEPLNIIAADDPVTCAIYAQDNNLLDKPGWKRFS